MRATALTGISDIIASASASKSRVKSLRGRAHGRRSCRISHAAHSTRGDGACRYAWCWKKFRCRHCFYAVSYALHPSPPQPPQANVPPTSKFR